MREIQPQIILTYRQLLLNRFGLQLTSGLPGSRDESLFFCRYPLDALDRPWMVYVKQVGQPEQKLDWLQLVSGLSQLPGSPC